MNDDFLYRIRTQPPADFAARLKAKLDAAPRRRAQVLRFGLGVLLLGTAFAMMVPGVRHSIEALVAPKVTPLKAEAPGPVAPIAEPSDTRSTERPPPPAPLPHPAPRLAEISPTPAAVNAPRDDAHDATSSSDSSAVSLAARGREISERDLFTTAIPAWPVAANDTEAQTAIAARRALFRVITSSFEPVDAMTREQRELDRGVVALSAYRLLQLSTMIDDAYALDTRQWKDIEGVNSLVWNRTGVFRKQIQEFSAAARALLESAANGEPADVWRDAGRVSRSCWRCHDGFTTRRDLPPRR